MQLRALVITANVHYNWSTKCNGPYVKLMLSKILTSRPKSYVKLHEILSRWRIRWNFYSKFQWNHHEFLTTSVRVFKMYFQCNHHHHHFWLASLTVRSATHSQQPPERSVLSHAASAWWRFTATDDHRRLEAVIRRGLCSAFCSADESPLSELVVAAGDH